MNTMCQIGVNMVDIRGEKKVRWQRRRRHGHSVRPRGTALTLSVAMAIAVLDLLALDTDTMAFYPFRDGAAGTTAVGTPILNVADKTRHVGTVSVKDATQVAPAPHDDRVYKGGVDFDDDAPAKYVFEGSLPGATVICTNPQSLHFTGDPERWSSYDKQRAGGNVSFADIGSELSTCDEYTLEFFWKVDADAFYRADDGDILAYNCGYLYNDEPAETRLVLPENAYMARVWFGNQNVKQLSLNYSLSPTGWPTDGSMTFIGDGKWHHFVLRQIKGGDGSLGYASYFDYVLPDHNTRNKPKEPVVIARGTVSGSAPLDLGRYFYRGKIACLRIIKRNLADNELLRVSNDIHYRPDLGNTVFHWRLDGAVGTSVSTISNSVPDFRAVNPNLFYATASAIVSDQYTGAGVAVSDENAAPVYTDALPYPRKTLVYAGAGRTDDRKLWTNLGSVHHSPAAVYDNNGWMKSTPGLRTGQTTLTEPNFNWVASGSFTCECFVRIDRTAFLAKNKVASYPRVGIMGSSFPSYSFDWKLFFDYETLSGEMHMRPQLQVYVINEGETKPTCYSDNHGELQRGKLLDDEKWHHVAVVYDDPTRTFTVYVDYELTNLQITLPVPYVSLAKITDRMLRFGYGLNDQNLEGAFDEIRYSRVALTPDEFLRCEREKTGLSLIVR